jgi:hypothetical protein
MDSQKQFVDVMSDHDLLAELQQLDEDDDDGVVTSHHITMLQKPMPTQAELNGLAELVKSRCHVPTKNQKGLLSHVRTCIQYFIVRINKTHTLR